MQTAESTITERALRWAADLYPPEQRAWGEAILAESYSVAGLGPRLWWTIGGLTMALRIYLENLFNPAKKSAPLGSAAEAPAPPIPWKRVMACFAIAAALFLFPDFRQGLSLVVYSWHGYRDPQITSWQKLGREAKNKGDAAAMAYAAMRLPLDQAIPLAQRAVTKDPSLTWVHYFVHGNNYAASKDSRVRRLQLLTALSKWDPDNAVPYLAIAANASSQPNAYKDPQWLAAMNNAVAAESYDSYFPRRLALQRKLNKTPSVHDTLGNIAGYWIQTPWVSPLNEYATFLQRQAEASGSRDVWEESATQLWALANLGSRIHLNALSFGERYDSSEMQEVAFAHLQPVLLKLGRTREAQSVSYAAQLVAAERARSMPPNILDDHFLETSAVAAHLLTLLIMISSLLLAIAAVLFAWQKSASGFARMVLTHSPMILVASCVAFLGVSYPYARAADAFLTNPMDFDAILRLASLSLVQPLQINWFLFPRALYFWWSVIVLGTALSLWMALRAFRHHTT